MKIASPTLLALTLTILAAPASAQPQGCMDLVGVDFGECEMAMGIALVDSWCVYLSGCGSEVDGVDYAPYIYADIADCWGCTCVDSSMIDPTALCITLWDPVCGCDSVTYSNDCFATVWGGVTSWTQGECETVIDDIHSVAPFDPRSAVDLELRIDPANGLLHFAPEARVQSWTVQDATGRTVATGRSAPAQLSTLPPGLYIAVVRTGNGIGSASFFWP
jgi:hypothetical protein